jgi:hypothetical protein
LRYFGVIDIGIGESGADAGLRNAALVASGHALHVHHFLMIGAVVVHYAQQRNAVMRCGPKNAV